MNSAILVIGFKRPGHLQRVLERVREAEPRRIFIAIDGPRRPDEVALTDACGEVAHAVDWAPLEVRLRKTNLGCQRGVIDAVSWMLESEPEGVIVEDDSLPSRSFFPFCDELLERYRNDPRVLAISGESRVPSAAVTTDDSYRFTYMGAAGAWATWRDRWQDFTTRRVDRDPLTVFRALSGTRNAQLLQRAHWAALTLANKTRVMDSWAYPFMLEGMTSQRLTATPNANLVADHGIDEAATHTTRVDPLGQTAGELQFPLSHPPYVRVDESAERWSEEHEVGFGLRRLARNGAIFTRRIVGR